CVALRGALPAAVRRLWGGSLSHLRSRPLPSSLAESLLLNDRSSSGPMRLLWARRSLAAGFAELTRASGRRPARISSTDRRLPSLFLYASDCIQGMRAWAASLRAACTSGSFGQLAARV